MNENDFVRVVFRKTIGKKQKSAHSALRNFISVEVGKEDLLNELFSRWVDIELSETDTIWAFELESTAVSQYDDEAPAVASQNAGYETKRRSNNDMCVVEVTAQTVNARARPRKIQTKNVKCKDSSTLVTMWQMHDDRDTINVDLQAMPTGQELNNTSILRSLVLLERVISLNLYQERIATYRGIAESALNEVCDNKNISQLWSFKSPITAEYCVTCLDYSDADPDTLCVGYSQGPAHLASSKGLVCCWFLRNLLHPECYFYCRSGVTAVDVCIRNLSRILAVGMSDGSVAVYDITGCVHHVVDSLDYFISHSSPILAINWINASNEDWNETVSEFEFITASTDGFMFRWQLDFQLSKTTFMETRKFRMTELADFNNHASSKSITKGILALALHPTNPAVYLIATEVGTIYLCSAQHSDRYLAQYTAHEGPVHKVVWCPQSADMFISCSADWTLKLWLTKNTEPIITFRSNLTSVLDVAWSPLSSTTFASASRESIEIWDLAKTILKPSVVQVAEAGEQFTTVLFSPFSQNLMIGTSHGEVKAYNVNLGNHDTIQITLDRIIEKYSKKELYLKKLF